MKFIKCMYLGYRMRVHFDGYPENYDFWINADSMNIFPAGWSEKNGKKLDPPKGYTSGNFNWNANGYTFPFLGTNPSFMSMV